MSVDSRFFDLGLVRRSHHTENLIETFCFSTTTSHGGLLSGGSSGTHSGGSPALLPSLSTRSPLSDETND